MTAWISRQGTLATVTGLALSLVAVALVARAQPATPAAAGCPAATPAPSPVATVAATSAAMPNATPVAERCVTIGMYDIYFQPKQVTIPANTPVTIVLANKGAAPHNFSITDHENRGVPNLNVSVDVQPGEVKEVTIQAPPGTYYFFCNVPGHEQAGMTGHLEVKVGAAIATGTAGAGS
jgi:uncharacterized cupredoxin-like copper-binding protein